MKFTLSWLKEHIDTKKSEQQITETLNKIGLEVHAGHGLNYQSTKIISKIKNIKEFNIGHFIIGEAIFFGLPKVISNFKNILKT